MEGAKHGDRPKDLLVPEVVFRAHIAYHRGFVEPAFAALGALATGQNLRALFAGVLGALVSGSGPTCAFLVESAERADRVAESLRTSGTCAAAVRADGPAPGTAVV